MSNTPKNLAVTITPPGGDHPLTFTLLQSPPIYRGVPVSGMRLVGKGGVPPYGYSIVSGSLPAGLTLNVDGTITGTPTTVGHSAFLAEVTDFASTVFPASCSIDVVSAWFVIQGEPTPGELIIPYSYQFIVKDISGTVITSGYTVASGSLPAGLTLSSAGLLSGTPTTPVGVSYFVVNVTDGTDSVNIQCAVKVLTYPIPYYVEAGVGSIGIGGNLLPPIPRGQPMTFHLLANGGQPPYTVTYLNVDTAGLVPASDVTITPSPVGATVRVLTTAPAGTTFWEVNVADALGSSYNLAVTGTVVSPLVTSVVAGTNVTVDNTDPLNPIVSSIGGSGGGPITARLATAAALPANTYANGTAGVGATLTATATGVLTVDGKTVALDDIVLAKDESTAANNGAYKCTTAGASGVAYILTRVTGMDQTGEFPAALVSVGPEGTANANTLWQCTATPPVTVGTTAIGWQKQNGASGGSGPFVIPLYSGNASTDQGSTTKLVLGSVYFDPTDTEHGLSSGSTATLCMLLESSSGSVAAAGELFQKSGTGSPQIIAATGTTTSTTAALVTADVSAAFTDTSAAGIFVARLWIVTPNGFNEATCTGAWIEVTP